MARVQALLHQALTQAQPGFQTFLQSCFPSPDQNLPAAMANNISSKTYKNACKELFIMLSKYKSNAWFPTYGTYASSVHF